MKRTILPIWLIACAFLQVLPQATPPSYKIPKPRPKFGSTPNSSLKVFTGAGSTSAYNDPYPVVWDCFVGGGRWSVGTIQERNDIPIMLRKEGMLVYVAENQGEYRLNSNLASWTDMTTVFSARNFATGDLTANASHSHNGNTFNLAVYNYAVMQWAANIALTIQAPNIQLNGQSTTINASSISPYIFEGAPGPLKSTDQFLVWDSSSGKVKHATGLAVTNMSIGVNLYNSNGTLTDNRQMQGAGHDLGLLNLGDVQITSDTFDFETDHNLTMFSDSHMKIEASDELWMKARGSQVYMNDEGIQLLPYWTVGNTNSLMKIVTRSVGRGTATVGQVLTLVDLANGAVEFADAPAGGGGGPSTNIYNSDGVLTGERTINGDTHSLLITNVGVGQLSASSILQLQVGDRNQIYMLDGSVNILSRDSIKIKTPANTDSQAQVGSALVLTDTDGSVEYSPLFYKGVAAGSAPTWTVDNSALAPWWASSSHPPEGTVAYVKFPDDSVGSDTIQIGLEDTALPIVNGAGTSIGAGDITHGQYVMLIRSGVGSGAAWTLQTAGPAAAPSPGSATAVTVDTVSDLVDVDKDDFPNVITRGYWAVGDGGAAMYYWGSDTTSTNHGSRIASSITGAWNILDNGVCNVLQWGVKRDGVTPVSDLINEAFTWAGTQVGHRILLIPQGDYAVDSTIYVRYGDVEIRQKGNLRNVDNNPTEVFVISPAWRDHNLTLTAGVPTLEAYHVTIDGGGTGVIDQNSQNQITWDADNPTYGSYHSLVAFGIQDLTIRNLTVTNSMIWAMTVELCADIEIHGCKVYNGLYSHRQVAGVFTGLGTQDGIHAHDSMRGKIHDNFVVSGDDGIAVTSSRAWAGDFVVSRNHASTRPIAYAADGTTPIQGVSGRYALTAYCLAQTANCGITNVVFANNIVDGGSSLFNVSDEGVTHGGKPTSIKFIGNIFSGQTSPGNPAVTPIAIQFGWCINGSEGVELIDNTFENIARIGRIGGSSAASNGTVTWRGNKFSAWKVLDTRLMEGTPRSIIMMTQGTRLIVEDNLFENNELCPIGVGSAGDITSTNQFAQVIVNNNRFANNNTLYASATPTNYSAILWVNGANYVEFSGNTISTNYGRAVQAFAVKSFIANGNNIRGLGNGSFSNGGDAFYIYTRPNMSLLELDISNNRVADIDGQFIDCYNPGAVRVFGNNVKNAGRSHSQTYLITCRLDGSSLASDPYVWWSGIIDQNVFMRGSAQTALYVGSTFTATGFTGTKLRYSATGNYTSANYTSKFINSPATALVEP